MPIDERWETVLQEMHTAARPGALRTDFPFERLREAYSFVEHAQNSVRNSSQRLIGSDERLGDCADNVRLSALVTYFLSNHDGDDVGTGVATCYSGTRASDVIEGFVQPPVALRDWTLSAFLDMCESTAEFIHRAKWYWNGKREHKTQVTMTPVRFKRGKFLSVDSDFGTRETREGDFVYTIMSNRIVLGSSDEEDIINGPRIEIVRGDGWLLLYVLAKLAWRLDMLNLSMEYGHRDSCRVNSVFYHFIPVFKRLAMDQKFRNFGSGDGFDTAAKINGFEVVMKSERAIADGLHIKNQVYSMAFSAVLAMWRSWLSNDDTRVVGRIPPNSKLHRELKTLEDVNDFDISTKYDNVEACLWMLIYVLHPDEVYYQGRLYLYEDVLTREKFIQMMSSLCSIDVKSHLRQAGVLNSDSADEATADTSEDDESGDEYVHYAGVTQNLPIFEGPRIRGVTCLQRKGWTPQSLCKTRYMFMHDSVPYRVTVENGRLKSSVGFEVFSNALKTLTRISFFGVVEVEAQFHERHYNDSTFAIANGLLSGSYGEKPALWMLNLMTSGLIKVNRERSKSSVAQCAKKVSSRGVRIDVELPLRVTCELAHITHKAGRF